MNKIAVAILITFGATALQAVPADPQGVFDNAIAGLPVTPVVDFPMFANQNGGGVYNFQNMSGNDWVGMDFFVTLPNNTPITCGGGPFFQGCEVSSTPNDISLIARQETGFSVYDIGFFDAVDTGIAAGTIFSINLNDPIDGQPNLDPNGAGGWGSNNSFLVVPTAGAPEPSSWLLLASGIALIGTFRRVRSHKS